MEPGALVDVVTHAQSNRDVYLVLDQAEEYFTYHGDGDGFDAALARLVDGSLRVNVLLSLREDTLAALDRLKAAIPNLFGNVCASTTSTAQPVELRSSSRSSAGASSKETS